MKRPYGLLILSAAIWPVAAQPSANDILAVSRAALGGKKLESIQSITLWGPDRRGAITTEMSLSAERVGRFLKENTILSSGGETQRAAVSDDGAIMVGGGMPGDDGGPAFTSVTSEGIDGNRYWAKLSSGEVAGGAETIAATRQQLFERSFALYMLALTLNTQQNFPMTYAYGGQVESPGGMADGIEGRGPNGFIVHLFIDSKTHLPVMLNYLSGAQNVQMWLKDYKAEEGVLFPHTLTWIANGKLTEEFQAQKFKINPKFTPAKFQR
ncbi:MAG TPA: hypothetical protein VHW24_13485 [Bryobacteraceae bacterium]|jgi:hypothetical protein|nr:hypothetical protein [Bryobacteraceae bacterium]